MKSFMLSSLLLSSSALAADAPPAVASAGTGLLQVLLALAVVVALLWGSLHLLKRLQAGRGGMGTGIKVVAATAVGPRERVVVVEIGEQWLVVGVAPGRVNALSTLPRQALPESVEPQPATAKDFAAWLKQMMEKRK